MDAPEPQTADAPALAVLDACVLVGVLRREFLFAAAKSGFYRPIWSARIEAEWRAALIREAAGAEWAADGELALARASFPDAIVEGWEELEGPLSLPDWNDRHVLAAAIAGGAGIIVTDNLRDFPRRALREHGVAAIAADEFLLSWTEAQPDEACAAIRAAFPAEPTRTIRAGLKRGRLPRFAKAVERLMEP